MKKIYKNLIIILIFLAAAIALRFSPIAQYLTFQNFIDHKEQLHQIVSNNYFISILVFMLSYILITLLFLPIAAITTIAGGFLFGVIPATIYINIGATVGSVLAFLASRYLIGNWFQEKYEQKLMRFNNELKENGIFYMFTLRLIPAIPFFLINILAGLTKLKLSTFTWTTSLGIIPASLVYTFAGKQLDTIEQPSDIFSSKILIAFLLLALLSLIPRFFKYFKDKNNYNNQTS